MQAFARQSKNGFSDKAGEEKEGAEEGGDYANSNNCGQSDEEDLGETKPQKLKIQRRSTGSESDDRGESEPPCCTFRSASSQSVKPTSQQIQSHLDEFLSSSSKLISKSNLALAIDERGQKSRNQKQSIDVSERESKLSEENYSEMLQDELFFQIFLFVPHKDLVLNCGLVSKRWSHLCSSKNIILWKHMCFIR